MGDFTQKTSKFDGIDFDPVSNSDEDSSPHDCEEPCLKLDQDVRDFIKMVKKVAGEKEKSKEELAAQDDEEIQLVMANMDWELSETTMAKSFERINKNDYIKEPMGDADIEANLLDGLFKSYDEEKASSGPASNLLKSLKIGKK